MKSDKHIKRLTKKGKDGKSHSQSTLYRLCLCCFTMQESNRPRRLQTFSGAVKPKHCQVMKASCSGNTNKCAGLKITSVIDFNLKEIESF